MFPWRRILSALTNTPRTSEPLLGRWCHKGSHARCDPFRKVDLANSDSCMTTMKPPQTPQTIGGGGNVPTGRDPVTCFVDGFGM